METLVRNATLRFSRRVEFYEPLNPTGNGDDHFSQQLQVSFSRPKSYREHKNGGMNIFSRAKSQRNHGNGRKSMFSRPKSYRKNPDLDNNMMKNSLSYRNRRDRARKRQIFLQSYKLTSMDKTSRLYSKTKNLKRVVVVKVKSLVVSLLSPLRFCNSRSAINAALPTRVVNCCWNLLPNCSLKNIYVE